MKTNTNKTSVEKLIEQVNNNELTKVNLNNVELLQFIIDNYNKVETKSSMLKLIRSENFKVSQDRCYNTYLMYKKSMEEDNKK